jgi:hypothetical protein
MIGWCALLTGQGWAIAGLRNRNPTLARCLQPTGKGNLELRDGLGRGLAVRRAEPQIRHIRNPALILVAPEDVDVLARLLIGWAHRSSFNPFSRTAVSSCRT